MKGNPIKWHVLEVAQAPKDYRWARDWDVSSACPVCHEGGKPSEPYEIKAAMAKNRDIFVHNEDAMVSDRVKNELLNQKIRGLAFIPIVDVSRTPSETKYFEIRCEYDLPPMLDSSNCCRDYICKHCKRSQYSYPIDGSQFELHYQRQPGDKYDCYATWELWGGGQFRSPIRDSVFGRPLWIVNERTWQIFKSFDRRTVRRSPVKFLE